MTAYNPESPSFPEQSVSGSTPVNEPVLLLRGVGKTYSLGDHSLTVLRGVNFCVGEGEVCAIIGPSGSGKTTLLGLCAGLDNPTEGTVILRGHPLGELDQDERAEIRSHSVGFVFQNFQLIPTLTALENVLVPLELRGERGKRGAAVELLGRVGLAERIHHYPSQLSGGEQQRVALARAFIHRPRILFADEPTGNLDEETSRPIVDMLFELNREHGTALVLITHDPHLAAKAGRVVRMRGGAIVEDGRTT